jgi:hypothetical protein
MILVTMPLLAASAAAQRGGGAGGGQPAANQARTIAGINSVWIEELTQPEFRDMIRDGYTTVLIMTGGVEDNSVNLAMGKHNINNKLLGEMIARKIARRSWRRSSHSSRGTRAPTFSPAGPVR